MEYKTRHTHTFYIYIYIYQRNRLRHSVAKGALVILTKGEQASLVQISTFLKGYLQSMMIEYIYKGSPCLSLKF